MEALKCSSLTYRLTVFPPSSLLSVESLWQARHSSLLGLGGVFGAGAAMASCAKSAHQSSKRMHAGSAILPRNCVTMEIFPSAVPDMLSGLLRPDIPRSCWRKHGPTGSENTHGRA